MQTSKPALSYKDVFLIPKYSELDSRSNADTSIELGCKAFKLPVIPSNMRSLINRVWAKSLAKSDYFYIMHRFDHGTVPFVVRANQEDWKTISISTGVNNDSLEELNTIFKQELRVDYITVDVAHGHSSKVAKRVEYLREKFPKAFIIAGNVTTPEGVAYLENAGAHAVKVLIGTGSVCTTRNQTGFSVPSFTAIQWCAEAATKPLIADGGINEPGDIAKALTAGANMVMSGKLFAACKGASLGPGKLYYGNASAANKKTPKFVEGTELPVENVGEYTIEETLKNLQESLQSSISYAGGKDLSCFNHVQYGIYNNVAQNSFNNSTSS